MKSYQKFAFIVILCLINLFINSCTTPSKREASIIENAQPSSIIQTQQNYLGSAEYYLHLSENTQPPQQHEYQLLAADMLLKTGKTQTVQALLDKVPSQEIPQTIQQEKQFLQAELFILNHNPTQALGEIFTLSKNNHLSYASATRLFKLRITAYEQLGDLLESAKARVALDTQLVEENEKFQSRKKLWETLQKIPLLQLKQQIENTTTDFSGWASLMYITRHFNDKPKQLTHAIAKWKILFPNHPAIDQLEQALYETKSEPILVDTPKQIALLLPLTGPFQEAAQAIREGFFASFYMEQNKHPSTTIRVYDTTTNKNIYTIYRQAVKDGADFVVGPLQKQAVSQLIHHAYNALPVPTLTLNQTSNPMRPIEKLYQFALSPEDEATQLAPKISAQRYRRAVIIVSDNDWGKRIVNAFQEAFKHSDTKILQTTFIDPNQDQAAPIRELFKINQSQARSMEVKRLIKEKVNFQPRRRQDIDVIILATPPEQARQLRPLFDFYYAENIPIYATPSIYSGFHNPKKDRDMDGIIFCDMPWLLLSNQQANKVHQKNYGQHDINLRLYAMGMDAFKLSIQLNQLTSFPTISIHGATGILSLNTKNQIERKLICAKIKNGRPQPL